MEIKRAIYFLLFAILIVAYFFSQKEALVSRFQPESQKFVTVAEVIDGDSLVVQLDDNKVRIRLIGIDAPEASINEKALRDAKRRRQDVKKIVELGKKSKAYLKRLLPVGSQVRLSNDVARFDHYGRLLAYVFNKDNVLINAKILEDGYAYQYTVPPNIKYQQDFSLALARARELRLGLWAN